jgi:hypothetical protein
MNSDRLNKLRKERKYGRRSGSKLPGQKNMDELFVKAGKAKTHGPRYREEYYKNEQTN